MTNANRSRREATVADDTPRAAARLHLALFGGVAVTLGDAPLSRALPAKSLALLSYLAVTGRPQSRGALAALLWGEMPDEDARANLRQALTRLRPLAGSHLVIARDAVAFDRTAPYLLDTERFEEHLRAVVPGSGARHLRAAVALYAGDFMEGFAVRDAPMFEEWQAGERERLRLRALQALHELAVYHAGRAEYLAAGDALGRLLALDPWREDAHQQLMLVLARSGQRAAALAQFDACRRVLKAELGVEPSSDTVALAEQIRVGQLAWEATDSPPAESGSPTAMVAREVAAGGFGIAPGTPDARQPGAIAAAGGHSLPAALTPTIGRDADLASLLSLFQARGVRLVTLIGAGGVGKTRLAVEAAQGALGAFPDGIFFVPLAPLTDAASLAPAIATAIGLSLHSGDPRQNVLHALRDRHLLLVLDNFEHLLDGAELVVDILERAPEVRVVATSREPLMVRGEHLFPVDGLAGPTTAGLAEALNAPAVCFFMEAARRVRPGFALSEATLPDVLRICTLVGGTPLALELAAVRADVLSPGAIADEIALGTDFLVADWRDIPDRQRSMRAVFDWSWRLLTEDERQVFRQLSIFRGGFDREAAKGVAGASLVTLLGLVRKSLLRRTATPNGADRYDLHEMLRQFAAERLVASGDAGTLGARHATHFLALAEGMESHLTGPDQATWMARLEGDHDNLRAALAWARAHGAAEVGLRLAGALIRFWSERGYPAEGRVWIEDLLALPGAATTTTAIRARACYGAGVLANLQGDKDRAVRWLDQSIALSRAAADSRGIARALQTRAGVAYDLDDLRVASALFGEYLELARAAGDAGEIAAALGDLGETELRAGDLAGAAARFAEALPRARAVGRRDVEASVLDNLGDVARQRGDLTGAGILHKQALELKRQLGAPRRLAISLENLAGLAAAQGMCERAARLLGAAEALRTAIGVPRPVPEQRAVERAVAPARAALGGANWEVAFAAGRAVALEEALAEAAV